MNCAIRAFHPISAVVRTNNFLADDRITGWVSSGNAENNYSFTLHIGNIFVSSKMRFF